MIAHMAMPPGGRAFDFMLSRSLCISANSCMSVLTWMLHVSRSSPTPACRMITSATWLEYVKAWLYLRMYCRRSRVRIAMVPTGAAPTVLAMWTVSQPALATKPATATFSLLTYPAASSRLVTCNEIINESYGQLLLLFYSLMCNCSYLFACCCSAFWALRFGPSVF